MLTVCCQGTGLSPYHWKAKRGNKFVYQRACLHCSETPRPQQPFLLHGWNRHARRMRTRHEAQMLLWNQAKTLVGIMMAPSPQQWWCLCRVCIQDPNTERVFNQIYFSAANKVNPALSIYQEHWGNWLKLTLLTFLAATSKVSFHISLKPENVQLINELFGGWYMYRFIDA